MKCAVIRGSDLGTRWDAKYHIARVSNQAVVDKLMAIPEDQFKQLLDIVPRHHEALEVVLRGNSSRRPDVGIASIRGYTKLEQAVFLAVTLSHIAEIEKEAATLVQQAESLRNRKAEIERIIQ